MSPKNILVIGSANADLVIHTETMPKLGQTVMGKDFSVNAGGKGLNQAVAIAKLGGKPAFLGAVGNDANGKMLLDTLEEFGADFVGRQERGLPTGIAVITVVGGENVIVLNSGANDCLTPQVIKSNSKRIVEADFIVLQLEIPISAIVEICEIAKKGNAKILLNPAPYKALPKSLFPMLDYLIPNEHEAESITGIYPDSKENCILAIQKLRKMGVKNIIITLGERGCVYNNGDGIVFCPAAPAETVDTTSAGDSFIGAVTVSLAENRPLTEAIAFATKVAAITVSRTGAAKSIPFAWEVNAEEGKF